MRSRTSSKSALMFISVFILSFFFAIPHTEAQENPGYPTIRQGPALGELDPVKDLLKEGKCYEAEKRSREILEDVEGAYGCESIQVAQVLDILVESIWRIQDLDWNEYIKKRKQAKSRDETNALHKSWLQRRKALMAETQAFVNRAISILEINLRTDHPDVAKSLYEFGVRMRTTGDWPGATPLFERALEKSENIYGPHHIHTANILHDLGHAYHISKDYIKAKEFFERALFIKEDLLGPDDLSVAETLEQLGYTLRDSGKLAEARIVVEHALAIRENSPDSDPMDILADLGTLSGIESSSGNLEECVRLEERKLIIIEKAYGPEHPRVADQLFMLATSHNDLGDFIRAREYYEQALEIEEKIYGLNDYRLSDIQNSLAIVLEKLGDFERARTLYERILSQGENTHVQGNLASLLITMGEYAQAETLIKQVLEREEYKYGPDNIWLVGPMGTYARCLRLSGNFEKAMEIETRVISILEKYQRSDLCVNHFLNLAAIYRHEGESHKALDYLTRAQEIREKSLGPNNIAMTWLLNDFALHLLWDGELSEALEKALRSATIAKEHQSLMTRSLSERQALAYASSKSRSLDICLTLAATRSEWEEETVHSVWNALIQSRAFVLDEMALRNRSIAETADPEVSALADSLGKAHLKLANLMVRGPNPGDPGENYRELMDKAGEEKEKAERALAEASIPFREEIKRSRAGLSDIKESLPQGYALVAFARYLQYKPPDKEKGEKGDKADSALGLMRIPSYLAFVLRSQNDEPEVIPLGTAEEIEPLIFDWGQEAARGTRIPGRSAKEAEAAYRASGEALRRKVWDPIISHLGKTEKVFVIPDGAVNLLSFAALPTGNGKFLIETGPLMHYLSAERDLISSDEAQVMGTGLLALGDPSFDEPSLFAALSPEKKTEKGILTMARSFFHGTRSNCGDFRTLKFTPLPYANKEIEEITKIWEKSSQREGDVLKLTGERASEREFKITASGKQIIHLATHGFFLEGSCQSFLTLPEKQNRSEWEGEGRIPPVTGENPLLLSGLALAGANHRDAAGPEEEDGILTAEEVAALDLSGVDWVVLSACDTGIGKIRAGEGVFGLRRAFRLAGARTLITSLWSVEDEDAQNWMKALYAAHFREGHGTAEAVREASLEVLRELRKKKKSTHPYHWAGFVASGDWR